MRVFVTRTVDIYLSLPAEVVVVDDCRASSVSMTRH